MYGVRGTDEAIIVPRSDTNSLPSLPSRGYEGRLRECGRRNKNALTSFTQRTGPLDGSERSGTCRAFLGV